MPVLVLCHPALLGRSHRMQVCWNSSLESTRPLVSPCRSRAVFGAVLAVLVPCQARGLSLPGCLHVGRLEELLLSCSVETGVHLTLHACCESQLCFSVPRYLLDWQGGNPDFWFLPPRDLINRTSPCCAVGAGDRPPKGLNGPTLQCLPEPARCSSLCCPLCSGSRAGVALVPQSTGSPVKPILLHSPHGSQVGFGGFSFKCGHWWWDGHLCVGLAGCSLPSVLLTNLFQLLLSPNQPRPCCPHAAPVVA